MTGLSQEAETQLQVFVELLLPSLLFCPAPASCPLHMPCAHDRRGKACACVRRGWGIYLPIYLIDFLLFSLPLCPEALGSHHGSGPSSWNQDKEKGLLEATSTLPLSSGL